jgi:prepilin-type N-terminal cleavage/methylation domain
MKKAFTLIELMVGVALLAMVLAFTSVIFKVSIESYRQGGANMEIMQKLRAITDQLNSDFKGLQKDGYLMLHSEEKPGRQEFKNSPATTFRADRLYYFSTVDFQSWFNAGIRSNIAMIYFGQDYRSLEDSNPILVSKWNLARDVELLTPGISQVPLDCNDISYAACKANIPLILVRADTLFSSSVLIDFKDPNEFRRLMCQNAGQMVIEWTDGTKDLGGSLAWFGFSRPQGYTADIETFPPPYYQAFWKPDTPKQYWPKALKFTFTLYDSKGILKDGRTFTHIVYIGE